MLQGRSAFVPRRLVDLKPTSSAFSCFVGVAKRHDPLVRDSAFTRLGLGEGRSPSGCDTLPMFNVLEGTIKRRPAMQKISTMRTSGKNIFRGQLTIGLDLGDRSSAYCVLNAAG